MVPVENGNNYRGRAQGSEEVTNEAMKVEEWVLEVDVIFKQAER